MRFGTNVVVLLASIGLLACRGSQRDAQAPEVNPWADYKGTYAPGGAQDQAPSETKPKSIAVAPAAAANPGPAANPDDAKSVYGAEGSTPAAANDTTAPAKKAPKKRGAGKKGGPQKAPAKK